MKKLKIFKNFYKKVSIDFMVGLADSSVTIYSIKTMSVEQINNLICAVN